MKAKVLDRPILFYDDLCRYCRHQAARVRAGDVKEKLSILGFSDPLFRAFLADMPEEERLASMHVVDTRGRVHSAGAAVVVLLSLNPKTRRQGWLARLVPSVRRKIDREYRKVADRRSELSATADDAEPTTVRPRWTKLDR